MSGVIPVCTDQTSDLIFFCQNVSQGTTVQTAQSYVLILPMVTDVKDSVTVRRTAVMCLQDVGLQSQVNYPLTIIEL